MKNQKSGLPFSNFPFSFWDQFNQIKVFPIFGQFCTVGKFLPSLPLAEKLDSLSKNSFLFINFAFCSSTIIYLPLIDGNATFQQKTCFIENIAFSDDRFLF